MKALVRLTFPENLEYFSASAGALVQGTDLLRLVPSFVFGGSVKESEQDQDLGGTVAQAVEEALQALDEPSQLPEPVKEPPSVTSEESQRVYDHKPIYDAIPEVRVQLAQLKVMHRMSTKGLIGKDSQVPGGLKGLHPHQILEGITKTRESLEALKELAAELEASEYGIDEPKATPLTVAGKEIVVATVMPEPGLE